MTLQLAKDKTRDRLKKLILDRAYKKNSRFRTPAKIVSTYFDFLEVSLKHEGVELAGAMVYDEVKDLDIQAIGGPNHGIASILCRVAFLKKIGMFYVRDTMRQEGNLNDPRWIESRIRGGDRVAIVGDVISSGSQIIRAVESAMELGGVVEKIIVIVDSQDGGGVDRLQRYLATNMLDIPVRVLFTRKEIVNTPTFQIPSLCA